MAHIEVGVIALRAPDGTFLPEVSIYKEVPDAALVTTIEYADTGEQETILYALPEQLATMFSREIRTLRKIKGRRKRLNEEKRNT